jgi:folylpolyglutamate synthase/dihydropteroate synthase
MFGRRRSSDPAISRQRKLSAAWPDVSLGTRVDTAAFYLAKKFTRRRVRAMSIVTRKDVTAMLGELDDVVVTEIIATGTTAEELAQAHAWLANDEPLMNAGRPLPSGRVARVVEIVAAISEEKAEEEIARRS